MQMTDKLGKASYSLLVCFSVGINKFINFYEDNKDNFPVGDF